MEKDKNLVAINEAGTTRRRNDDRRGPRGRRPEIKEPSEFETITISIDRVARVAKGGRRFRFKALVASGDRKNRIGIGLGKGADVTAAVTKATARAQKNMTTINLNSETICHDVDVVATGAHVIMKPASKGTGIIAGGVVRSIIGLTGIKNLISKSLRSTNKVNIAYAVMEGLRQQTPKSEWVTTLNNPSAKKADKKESK